MAGFNPLLGDHRLSLLRLLPPKPDYRSAIVLERPGGYQSVTIQAPLGMLGFIAGSYRHMYRVDMAPHELDEPYQLPSGELARPFHANLKLTVEVADAVKIVTQQITDAWKAIESVIRLPLRQISRRHAPDQLASVEEQLHDYLSGRTVPEVGLHILRAAVSVELEGADLKREREKIQERHQRELDELNVDHRVKLEKTEAVHRRELDEQHEEHRRELEAAREEHHHALEMQRQEFYKEMRGEGLLEKLLLMKLGARPAGGDPKEVDEVIGIITQLQVDKLKVPLDLLVTYRQVMERWQLEEPVKALLKQLVATYGLEVIAASPEEPEIEVTVVNPQPAETTAKQEMPAEEDSS
jgi:hypothetical protein